MSRFPAVDAPTKSPGCCWFCRDIKGPMVDTLTNVQYQGSIYICNTCLTEMYNNLNDAPEPIIVEVPQNQESLNVLSAHLRDLANQFQSTADFANDLGLVVAEPESDSVDGDDDEDSAGDDSGDDEAAGKPDDTDPGRGKQANKPAGK